MKAAKSAVGTAYRRGLEKVVFAAVSVLALALGGVHAEGRRTTRQSSGPPGCASAKYVFLMIGDGLGGAQRSATEFFLHATEHPGKRKVGVRTLLMNTFPVQGLTTTYSYNSIITDSAAAGTAIACGSKTRDGVVAMDHTRSKNLKTVAEIAKQRGMKVGIVSSVSIDHATPACFYAHTPGRSDYWRIAMQLATSGFDYFGGGRAKGALQRKRIDRKTGKLRACPVESAGRQGYRIVTTREELMKCAPGDGKVWAYNHTVDANCALYYEIDRPEDHISLAEFTRKGIELLDNPKGFFMMVEGGKIDWACHANDAATVVRDVVAFDEAVAEAVKFYEKHPNETVIIVTGDHECGGMTIGFAGTKYHSFPQKLLAQKMSHIEFDKKVSTWRKNGTSFEEGLPVIKDIFGFTDLSPSEIDRLRTAFAASMAITDSDVKSLETFYGKYSSMMGNNTLAPKLRSYMTYGIYDPIVVECTHLLNRKAGIGWTSYSHTGVPVPTTAIGAGAEVFGGYYDNTDIFHKMMSVMAAKEKTARR